VLRSFPVVPWTTGATILQAEGLQIIHWIAFGIETIPWIGIRIMSFANPFTEAIPLSFGHRDAFLHFA